MSRWSAEGAGAHGSRQSPRPWHGTRRQACSRRARPTDTQETNTNAHAPDRRRPDDDRIVPIDVSGKRSATLIGGAKLEVIQGAPHGLNATHGEKLTKLMVEFARG